LQSGRVALTQAGLHALVVDDRSSDEWDRYVRQHPDSTLYHCWAWRDVVRDVYRRETPYLMARNQAGEVVGVLPLVRLRSLFFGDFLVSVPYVNYGGVLSDSNEAAIVLLQRAIDLARELKVDHIELRHTSDVYPDLAKRTDKVSMVLELPDDVARLQRLMSSKVRAQARRPLREGATCRHGGVDLLDDFYRVFSENMRDLGTPVYPKTFVVGLLEKFQERSAVLAVYLDSKPVAAAIAVGHGQSLEIPWASSLRGVNGIGVNMYLYWNLIEWAIVNGYRAFDFGRCTVDSGTYKFKRQWGASPRPLYWHYWMPDDGAPPQLNPSNPKYAWMAQLWRRQPVAIANIIGPHVVKNLP
jgi:FemAB-related protein (PEP-CTERM system-associated)